MKICVVVLFFFLALSHGQVESSTSFRKKDSAEQGDNDLFLKQLDELKVLVLRQQEELSEHQEELKATNRLLSEQQEELKATKRLLSEQQEASHGRFLTIRNDVVSLIDREMNAHRVPQNVLEAHNRQVQNSFNSSSEEEGSNELEGDGTGHGRALQPGSQRKGKLLRPGSWCIVGEIDAVHRWQDFGGYKFELGKHRGYDPWSCDNCPTGMRTHSWSDFNAFTKPIFMGEGSSRKKRVALYVTFWEMCK